MTLPTTGVFFNSTDPAAPPGDQNVVPQTDNGYPSQSITFHPQQATTALRGTVKPDGTTITVDDDGTIHAVAVVDAGGGTSAGGGLICVVPAGAKDGSNKVWTLPSSVLAGSGYFLVRNGVTQKQFGTPAEYAVSGNQITTATPLQDDDWQEFYYVPGTPSDETGGGGGVTPTTGPVFIQGATNHAHANSIASAFPSSNAAGNCLVVDAVGSNQGGTLSVSDSQGNTYISVVNGIFVTGNTPAATWVALNCSAGPNTVTVTIAGTPGGIPAHVTVAIHEYFGVASASAVDTSAHATTFSGSTPISVSVTTAVAGDLLHLSVCDIKVNSWGAATLGQGGSWTARESIYPSDPGTYVGGIASFDTVAGAAGSYSNTGTVISAVWQAPAVYLIALKPL